MKITKKGLTRLIKKQFLFEKLEFELTAQGEAEKINAQTGAGYVTDQAFWEKRGVITGKDLALSVLGQSYSDYYKEIYGFRPRHSAYKTVEEYTAAVSDLDVYYDSMIKQGGLDAQQQIEIENERQELAALMPGELDFEHVPRQSGMGRRMENKMRISRKRLSKIIKESMGRILNEYGASFGDVSWREDDESGVLFDIEGHGEDLDKDAVYDILNDSDTDDDLSDNIRKAIQDADDYDGGY